MPSPKPHRASSRRSRATSGRGASTGARPGGEPAYRKLSFQDIKSDGEVLALIEGADRSLAAMGFTDHGLRHIARVATRAMKIGKDLDLTPDELRLTGISAYLHDIGNAVHRVGHAQSSAIMAFTLLRERGMDPADIAIVMGAIGNHDEGVGEPVNNPGAALILADKSDVLRSRVRSERPLVTRDIHDRVNFAATDSRIDVNSEDRLITLRLEIDTNVSPVMDYFEIFLGRMSMCRRAANFLNCDFRLVINGTTLL
ncbi:MAG: HD domain-containing protein [Sumerlaeia bacterium]